MQEQRGGEIAQKIKPAEEAVVLEVPELGRRVPQQAERAQCEDRAGQRRARPADGGPQVLHRRQLTVIGAARSEKVASLVSLYSDI